MCLLPQLKKTYQVVIRAIEKIKGDDCGSMQGEAGEVWTVIVHLVAREDHPDEWLSGWGMEYPKEGTHIWEKSILGRC